MKIFMCIFLQCATMVAAAPKRVQRQNSTVLNDAFDASTEKTTPASITAGTSTREPETEQTSADVSEAKSIESLYTNGFTDPESYETRNSRVVKKNKSRGTTGGVLKGNTSLLDIQDQGSREHVGPVGAHQGSRELIDLNSQEGVTVPAGKIDILSGKQVIHLSGHQVTARASESTSLKRRVAPGRGDRLNSMLTTGRRREMQDPDSLEENNGRPSQAGNRGPPTDYDETRELISSETIPIATPERTPSGLPASAKGFLLFLIVSQAPVSVES